jgi:hypothetical protein
MQRPLAGTVWIATVVACSSLWACLTAEELGDSPEGAGEAARLGVAAGMPAVDPAALHGPSTKDPAARALVAPACGRPGTWEACEPTCPCGDGQGDCDDDTDCVPQARCMRDVGAAYDWPEAMDVCEIGCVPAEEGYVGTADFCSSDCLCSEGYGDCDSEAECETGLRCVDNLGPHFGFGEFIDVCLSPYHDLMNGTVDHCSVEVPCGSGHGDCDGHDECQPAYRCGYNLGPHFGFGEKIDVCLSPYHDLMNGTLDHCSEEHLCAAEHGDCDSNSECQPDLRCGFDLGPNFGFGSEVDVCMSPYHDLMNGTVDHCSEEHRCAAEHGDCDSDAECQADLRCGFDLGPEFGFGGEIDVCLSPHHDLMNGTLDHCSTDFPCAADHGDCDNDDECAAGTACVFNVGDQYGWPDTIDVCQPV